MSSSREVMISGESLLKWAFVVPAGVALCVAGVLFYDLIRGNDVAAQEDILRQQNRILSDQISGLKSQIAPLKTKLQYVEGVHFAYGSLLNHLEYRLLRSQESFLSLSRADRQGWGLWESKDFVYKKTGTYHHATPSIIAAYPTGVACINDKYFRSVASPGYMVNFGQMISDDGVTTITDEFACLPRKASPEKSGA